MRKVLIPTKLERVAKDVLTAHGGYAVIQDDKTPLPQQAAQHPDTHALIVRSERVTPGIMDALPRLKVVVRAGAGFDTIDTKYARKKGIDVMNTPGANSNAVAEEVVAMILADARHVVKADPSTRAGKWEKSKFMGRELASKTVGIVGLGNIGRLLAKRLAGFECTLLGYDPVISSERASEVNVELTDLDTLFARADYISLHIPENEETRGMVGERLLAKVKEGVTIVNCARSGIVDEAALRKVKTERGIRFLTDVYPKDEEGPKSVAEVADLMLPHLGASTVEANANAARRAAEELIDRDDKGIASYIVNRDIPEGLDEAYCQLANTLARLARCLVGRGTTLKQIETSFYGRLEPFADWLMVPVVAGIWEDFDRSMDFRAARKYLTDMGIEYVNRQADKTKGYGESVTVDLISEVDADNLRRLSIRGTVAESTIMVSRINEFDKLYFEPAGPTLFFLYEDRPGVIGAIGSRLARAAVNIEDMRNPHDAKTNRSLAILKVNQPVADELVKDISREIHALSAFAIVL
jgi:D-3-phosphoglycerate dehydrogenase